MVQKSRREEVFYSLMITSGLSISVSLCPWAVAFMMNTSQHPFPSRWDRKSSEGWIWVFSFLYILVKLKYVRLW